MPSSPSGGPIDEELDGRISSGGNAELGRVSIGSIEIDEGVREKVMTVLAEHGLTVPEALRILLTRLGTDRDFAHHGLVPSAIREPGLRGRSWDDFFDWPGIDIEEPADPPSQMREGF